MTKRLNHRMTHEAIAEGILLGVPQTARCGEVFTPRLRVGSGGKADQPGWPLCEICEALLEAEILEVRGRRLIREAGAMLAEAKRMQRRERRAKVS